ncbi:MAG TPA: TetR/AcrR family transcriptional regulator C-terminal domain-containing protein [Steroidobacteraceae bacterium]|nr:TetR/AcrR family transcriptional regulator C-terminal domain-containing protein [Steroidobacteraceae bacterium]
MSGESSRHCAAMVARLAAALREPDARITNIESAIAKSGVSLRDISLHFGGTRELILAMASELADRMAAPLAALSVTADLRARLLEFGEHVLELCATSHWRGLYRIGVTESIRKTELARELHEAGPGKLVQHLAAFLRMAQEGGALGAGDPLLLAGHFLSPLIAAHDPVDGLMPGSPPGAVARGTYVRNLVDLFCHGINRTRQLC